MDLKFHSLGVQVKRVLRAGKLDGVVRQDHMGNNLSPWVLLRRVPKEPSAAEVNSSTMGCLHRHITLPVLPCFVRVGNFLHPALAEGVTAKYGICWCLLRWR